MHLLSVLGGDAFLLQAREDVVIHQEHICSAYVATKSQHDSILDERGQMMSCEMSDAPVSRKGTGNVVFGLELPKVLEHGQDLGDESGVAPKDDRYCVLLPV